MKPKIVFTGLGAVCGAGKTVDEIFDAIVAGKSGIKEISSWDASRWTARMAAECDVENKILVPDRKLHKSISRTDMFGIYAADSALQQSGLLEHREKLDATIVPQFNDRSGIYAGSGGGNFGCNYDFLPAIAASNGDLKKFGQQFGDSVNPMWLLKNLPNNVLCHVGIRHQLKGANHCITNHCASGALAVAEAAEAIKVGDVDRAVAVGHDAPFEAESHIRYQHIGLLSSDTLRPFDSARSGTILGEGAAAVILETETDAKSRGAKIFGEFLGFGCAGEATGVIDIRSDGDGVSCAIEVALASANISRDEVGMIVAHGNGTRASDVSEARALRRVFGEKIPPVTGFKWAYGHSIAASGVLDLAVALTALQKKIVPGIAALNSLDLEIAPFPVSKAAQEPRGEIALLICRGFGGMNVATLVRANPS